MAGLTFPSLLAACFPIAPTPTRIFRSDDPPADRAVSVDDVLAALMEATAWISENCADDDELAVAIKDRLSMRSVRFDFSPVNHVDLDAEMSMRSGIDLRDGFPLLPSAHDTRSAQSSPQ